MQPGKATAKYSRANEGKFTPPDWFFYTIERRAG
jgi:hypothetical protein